jgi:hypothetical protein
MALNESTCGWPRSSALCRLAASGVSPEGDLRQRDHAGGRWWWSRTRGADCVPVGAGGRDARGRDSRVDARCSCEATCDAFSGGPHASLTRPYQLSYAEGNARTRPVHLPGSRLHRRIPNEISLRSVGAGVRIQLKTHRPFQSCTRLSHQYETGGSGNNMTLDIPLPKTPDGRMYRYSSNDMPRFAEGGVRRRTAPIASLNRGQSPPAGMVGLRAHCNQE